MPRFSEALWRSQQGFPLPEPDQQRAVLVRLFRATQNGSMTRHVGWLTRQFIEPLIPRSASSTLRTQVRPEVRAAAADRSAGASVARPFGLAVRR